MLVGNPQYVPLTDEGTFTADLNVTAPATAPGGHDGYGVFTYPASGATNPNHELEVRTPIAGTVAQDDAVIDWGVKTSFRNYITGGIANGSITTSGDVSQAAANGPFSWAAELREVAAADVVRSTDGRVVFTGHDGLLHLEISDVQVVPDPADPTVGVLHADVCSRSLDSDAYVAYPDVHLADLTGGTGDGGAVTYDAVLAPSGVEPFAGFYEAGAELDDVTATAPVPVR